MRDVKQCSWPGCTVDDLEDWRWGCGKHWNLLPLNIRELISARDPDGIFEARAWIRATFGGQERREYTPAKWETLLRMVRTRDEARARRRAARLEPDATGQG